MTVDVAEFRFMESTAVGIVVGAQTRIRQVGAQVAVFPSSRDAYRVLKRVGPTTGAVGAR